GEIQRSNRERSCQPGIRKSAADERRQTQIPNASTLFDLRSSAFICGSLLSSVIIVITCIIAIVVIAFVLGVRPKDIPAPEPVSPFRHLDERKAAIYENLRDLQFEYRVGKLSDEDYQTTKRDLQKELATVLAEVDKVAQAAGVRGAPKPAHKSDPN